MSTTAIELVANALLKTPGRREDIVKAIEGGDERDLELVAVNVCRNNRSFAILYEAVERTKLGWPKAIRDAIEYLRTRQPSSLFVS